MISNCGKDERGQYTGGQAGDQTGGEYAIINWYRRPWNCVLRHPNKSVRSEIARLARNAANNNKIGYDQGERLTFWNQLSAAGYDPGRITTPCEADCSSSTCAIVKAAGFQLKDAKLMSTPTYLTTYNMRNSFRSLGFDVLTDNKYLDSASYLLAGDILLNESSHAAINLDDGANADKNYGVQPPVQAPVSSSTGSANQSANSSAGKTGEIKKGDLVSMSQDAVWMTGALIAPWIKKKRWYVIYISGKRAVLGKSEDGLNNILSPIRTDYLTVAKAAEKPSGTTAEKPTTQTGGGSRKYVVQPGDTLSGIAKKYGVTLVSLISANGIVNPNRIFVGQEIIIP